MKLGRVNNVSFGATLEYGIGNLASSSVENGMSKGYVQGIIKKVNQLFPQKEYFISYFDYVTLDDSEDLKDQFKLSNERKICTGVTIERKNPKDWDPYKSIYKQALWPTYKEDRKDYISENELIAFYNAVKELATKDFSFEKNLPGGENVERIWLA